MLALAGYQLGIEFRFFDPNAGAPVGQIGQLIAADYGDHAALERFLEGVDVVTYEFESIPVSTVRFVAERMKVFPPPTALATAQDRLLEKQLFMDLKIPTPPFAAVDNIQDLQRAAARIGLPLVLKTRRMGYDGKGQAVIRDAASLEAAWGQLGGSPLIVEQFVEFQHELSVIGARDTAGREVFYPPIENVHREGILRKSTVPAPNVTPELAGVAIDYRRRRCSRRTSAFWRWSSFQPTAFCSPMSWHHGFTTLAIGPLRGPRPANSRITFGLCCRCPWAPRRFAGIR
jgi:5-(carboxyamino)imidazole ribonucleotide synthase